VIPAKHFAGIHAWYKELQVEEAKQAAEASTERIKDNQSLAAMTITKPCPLHPKCPLGLRHEASEEKQFAQTTPGSVGSKYCIDCNEAVRQRYRKRHDGYNERWQAWIAETYGQRLAQPGEPWSNEALEELFENKVRGALLEVTQFLSTNEDDGVAYVAFRVLNRAKRPSAFMPEELRMGSARESEAYNAVASNKTNLKLDTSKAAQSWRNLGWKIAEVPVLAFCRGDGERLEQRVKDYLCTTTPYRAQLLWARSAETRGRKFGSGMGPWGVDVAYGKRGKGMTLALTTAISQKV
jgi:hypothetical protein